MEKYVTMVELQSYWKLIKLIIGSSKQGKNRYNRRMAELLEINQVDKREWKMWKASLQSWNCRVIGNEPS